MQLLKAMSDKLTIKLDRAKLSPEDIQKLQSRCWRSRNGHRAECLPGRTTSTAFRRTQAPSFPDPIQSQQHSRRSLSLNGRREIN